MPDRQKYKIVIVDNFGNETVDDILACENIISLELAKVMANALNDRFSGDASSKYFRVVKQDYKLHVFEP